MRLIYKTLLGSLFFVCNLAVSQTVYTAGEQQINTIKDILFPNLVIEKVPGAQGALAWQKVLQNKNSIVITTTSSTYIAPLESNYVPGIEDPTKETELLAILTRSQQAIFVSVKSPINTITDVKSYDKTWFVGGIGEKGICSLLMSKLAEKYKINYTYVPYKLSQQISNDMLGGHIDAHCTTMGALNVGDAYIKNNTGKLIYTFDKDFDAFARLFIYANKELPTETKDQIIKSVTRKLTEQEQLFVKNNNLTLDIHTKAEAVKIFNYERIFWNNLKKEKK